MIEEQVDAQYVPTGHLVYVAGATLFAAPFDLERLEVSGRAVQLLDGVDQSARGRRALCAVGHRDARVLAGGATVAANDRVGRSLGGATPLPIDPRTFWTPRLSPDGRQFAVVVEEGDTRQIWIHRFDSGAFSRVTDEGSNWAPVWSRDGAHLLYVSARNDHWHLMRQAADGNAAPEVLLRSADDELAPGGLSADGQSLIYVTRSPNGNGELRALDMATRRTAAIPIFPARVGMPALSPGGRRAPTSNGC